MAKKRPQPYNQSNTATKPASNHKAMLEKQIPSLAASFENASVIAKSINLDLDIPIDPDFLKSLISKINDDHSQQFASWIEKFSSTCKDLSKYQQKLEEEYQSRWQETQTIAKELEERSSTLSRNEDSLTEREANVSKHSQDIQLEESRLAEKESNLLDTETELSKREINAEHGFAIQKRTLLKSFESDKRELEKEHQQELTHIREEKNSLREEIGSEVRKLAELKHSCTDEENLRIQQLDEREYGLKSREHEILDDKNRIAREWRDITEAKDAQKAHIDREIQHERDSFEDGITRLNEKLDRAWNKVEEQKSLVENYSELSRALGESTPDEILEQLESLKNEKHNLQRKLDLSDTAEIEERNEYLLSRVNELENQLNEVRPDLNRYRQEAASNRIAATELQSMAQEKRVLADHKNILDLHINDLESRIEQLADGQKTQTPFPAMSNMDNSRDFRAAIHLEEVPDLKQFASELQHRIAQAEKVDLYYPIEDIRSLLGGLAMSQLHVFQGISGTGKTSLAKAFAKAMGGFCTDIAVQAGWRDREDLLGHYNAFERKFYEKDSLQALYQAQTLRWKDTCNVILLDEMNLSRPEQYFAEFLSALEKNDPNERLINLTETELSNTPELLQQGRKILVPRNTWFIGTANHDETTNELADKTYDRAHVMTLPKQDHRFKIKPYAPASFSFDSLQKAFSSAELKYEKQVEVLLDCLTNHDITQQLADTFDLGWGNRFERQAKRYIPVMLATGATEGDALDHLLSTRVMRSGKVTGRYDISADDIGNLSDSLEDFWITANLDDAPNKSLGLLKADRERKERGG
ncbi:conserved hypothetical protein [Oleispira antarctica RB-8]|uniref:ATPase dynein-related AAA domain-containing protein n=1 Tax=Oleispira antarctica RB-8 TaxID=698738 RepID=R4YP64_OLEAN|nr:conserved hypothetical protein [Oleispira antarctica RB-8]